MTDKKSLITIDTSAIAMIEQDGDQFMLVASAEDGLKKLLELEKIVAEVKEMAKDKLKQQMIALNCTKIEGEEIKVSRRYYGEKYEITDKQIALGLGLATTKVVETTKIDSKAVEQYIKETETMPDGVKLKDRTESIVIQEVGAKE